VLELQGLENVGKHLREALDVGSEIHVCKAAFIETESIFEVRPKRIRIASALGFVGKAMGKMRKRTKVE